MFQIDLKSRKAIYEQVVDNFKRLITTGILRRDEKVPSIRELAGALNVNPNTVQKAYRELENRGYFYTVLGQGSFIAPPPEEKGGSDPAVAALFGALRDTVRELSYRGVRKSEIVEFINNERGEEVLPDDKN